MPISCTAGAAFAFAAFLADLLDVGALRFLLLLPGPVDEASEHTTDPTITVNKRLIMDFFDIPSKIQYCSLASSKSGT
jgi:hypothetical protein